ncbi:alpha/beta hydrolase [Paenibacillus sp. p3-SID867]|uniref:alpha/beta hydrolase n=1 Tax=Paenibacillus sp. p3-SID867 TaxID=2916363 RepID=UPI0021A80A99|nr:alpha/beta hydrolase [Paenibacillus sp. p3-SID867]MCT1402956.1 alpha/beta hydrolase [Paenibacillus sp. p3-SID867]
MNTIIQKTKDRTNISKIRIRKITTILSLFFSSGMFLLLLGVMVPTIPYIGDVGTILETFLSLHLVIISIIIVILSFIALCVGGKRACKIALTLSIVNVIGFSVPLVSIIKTANDYNVDISWSKHWSAKLSRGKADLSKSIQYASVDGIKLHMDISLPDDYDSSANLTPVIFLHGGGFVSGERGQNPHWTKFYNDRGYIVFDVDYRLGTKSYPTWDKASTDVATAIVWIGNHASKYNVDMNKLIIAGVSAGGGLALETAYRIQDKTIEAYLDGELYPAQFVVAGYPAHDLAASWNSEMFGIKGSDRLTAYIVGSPEEYKDAYTAINPLNHIVATTPQTIIVAGKADHLIPYDSHVKLADALTEAGIANELVGIPYFDHFYDYMPGTLGAQISYQVVADFLDKYGQ